MFAYTSRDMPLRVRIKPTRFNGRTRYSLQHKLSVYGSGVYFVACLCCLAPTDSSLQKGRAITLSVIACISAVYHKARILSSENGKIIAMAVRERKLYKSIIKFTTAHDARKTLIQPYYFPSLAPHQAFRVPR